MAGNYSNEQTNRRNCKRDPCYQKKAKIASLETD